MLTLLTQIIGPLGALVLAVFVAYQFQAGNWHGKDEFDKLTARCEKLESSVENYQKAVAEYAQTGQTTRQLIEALTTVATSSRSEGHGRRSASSTQEP